MAAIKEHLENLIKEGGTSDEDNADFEAAFSDESAESSVHVAATAPVINDDTHKGPDPDPAAAAKTTAAPAATDATQAGKLEPDQFSALKEQMQGWMREMGGRIGGMRDELNRMSSSARATASAQGAASPSKEQVEAAAKDAEAWNALKKEYPEWGDAIEKQMSVVEQRILGKVPKVDENSIVDKAVKASGESARSEVGRLKAALPIYVKYPNWEETINTPEFKNHMLSGGPTADEYTQYKQLETSEPAKAGEFLNELIRKHPNWWAEKGSKFFSDSITDAIAMLDSFEAAKAAANQAPAEKGRQAAANKARLETAVTPTSGATRVKQTKSDHQEFEEAFSS